MKNLTLILLIGASLFSMAQNIEIEPDLNKIDTAKNWALKNREYTIDEGVHFNAEPSDGLLWIKDVDFSNGTIELDIRGKDEQGKSFVGLAFQGLKDSVYEVVNFRAFNFKNPERYTHAVQYVSHPEFPWHRLRKEFPETYENEVTPVPEPTDWFHATIVINYPEVKVFVNNAKEPSLTVNQISKIKHGWVGFWAGYGSEGSYRNLKIIPN
jgi:hypothetical protein